MHGWLEMPHPENLLGNSFTIKEKVKRGRGPSLSFFAFLSFLGGSKIIADGDCSHEINRRLFLEVAQSCPTLCYPVDCSPPGSSTHGILQAIILEWVAISFSGGSS